MEEYILGRLKPSCPSRGNKERRLHLLSALFGCVFFRLLDIFTLTNFKAYIEGMDGIEF